MASRVVVLSRVCLPFAAFMAFLSLGCTGLPPGQSGSDLSVAAQTSSGSSGSQDGITPDEQALISPLPVGDLSALTDGGAVVLRWTGTGSTLRMYQVLRCVGQPPCEAVGEVAPVDDNRGTYEFRDPMPGSPTSYMVVAVSPQGTASDPATIPAPPQ